MTSSLTGQMLTALSGYSSRTRLYELKFDDELAGGALASLLVEAFSADE